MKCENRDGFGENGAILVSWEICLEKTGLHLVSHSSQMMSVPNRGFIVSKNDLIRWNDPRKMRTVALNDFDPWGSSVFQLHECGYLPDSADWHYENLCSPYWRLYANGKKGANVEIEGHSIPLPPDQIVIIPENTPFNARGRAGVSHLWIHFSPPVSLRFIPECRSFPLDAPLSANVSALRKLLNTRTHLEESGKKRLYHACLAVLHGWFAGDPLPMRPPLPPALSRVLETIERSLPAALPNAFLSAHVGMSLEGFIRWFKQGTGTTPARYVARCRVREACHLLSLTDRSIEEIAEAVGFANRHHFSRVFLHYAGRSPAQFRREQSPSLP